MSRGTPPVRVPLADEEFRDETMAPNQPWQTDPTYLKVIGRGWLSLSAVLDDFSRYIGAWKLCPNMRAGDITDILEFALQVAGLDSVAVVHRSRLFSDNGSSYISRDLVAQAASQLVACTRPASRASLQRGRMSEKVFAA